MDNKLQNQLGFLSLVLGALFALFGIIAYITELPSYITIAVIAVLLVCVNIYFIFSVKEVPEDGTKIYSYPKVRESKLSSYSLIAIPILAIGVCCSIYVMQSEDKTSIDVTTIASDNGPMPCESELLTNRSICIAKFSPEAFDEFSQSLILELSEKTDSMQLRLIDHNKFVYSGRNEEKQIDSIRLTNCIDTGIIVHGFRSDKAEMFFCRVHFLNYQRNDTLIKNPDKIEFSYTGHVRYLSNFLLAQNESGNREYRYALNLLLDAKSIGTNDEFNSIVDYYIGDMYLNLNKLDSAQMYYSLASKNPSTIQDYAKTKMAMTSLQSRHDFMTVVFPKTDTKNERRERVHSLLNNQIIFHTSSFFRVKDRHEDSVRMGEFVEITEDQWRIDRQNAYQSKWLVRRYDSLYYFTMTTTFYIGDSNQRTFHSGLRKIWTVSTRHELECLFKRSIYSRAGGWDMQFKTTNKSIRKPPIFNIHYSWLYSLELRGLNPYSNELEDSWKIETERLSKIEAKLNRLFEGSRMGFTLKNEIDFNEIGVQDAQ